MDKQQNEQAQVTSLQKLYLPQSRAKKLTIAGIAVGILLLFSFLLGLFTQGQSNQTIINNHLAYSDSSDAQHKTLIRCVNLLANQENTLDSECIVRTLFKHLGQPGKNAFYSWCLAQTEPLTMREVRTQIKKRGVSDAEINQYLDTMRQQSQRQLTEQFVQELTMQCRRG